MSTDPRTIATELIRSAAGDIDTLAISEHLESHDVDDPDGGITEQVDELLRKANVHVDWPSDPVPTTDEAYSWRDQLAAADENGQRLQGELHAARRAAQELLTKEVLHTGSGRDGHLNEDDLKPLFAALRIELRL